jgi:hypothetical protein
MSRYDCHSSLWVSCKITSGGQRLISINLRHNINHKHYYDVSMPPGAAEIIRTSLEWSTPVSLVARIQEQYPSVTSNQVHSAWTTMSEVMWKRAKDQMESAKLLLEEYPDDVDVFHINVAEGVQQICWGMKRIANRLKGKVVEIGIDATCQPEFIRTSKSH